MIIDWILHNNICLVNSRTPIHIYARGASLLDLSVTSPDLFIDINYDVYSDTFDSDHWPIKLQFDIHTTGSACHSIRYWYDWEVATRHLNQTVLNISNNSYEDFQGSCCDVLKANGRRMSILGRAGPRSGIAEAVFYQAKRGDYFEKRGNCSVQSFGFVTRTQRLP